MNARDAHFPDGLDVSILIGGAVCHSAVAVRMIHGRITRTTPKAIQLTDRDGRQLWLPRFCLEQFGGGGVCWKLTKAFDRIATSDQWNRIDRMSEISGVSAD
jgi:hypothetical protein